MPIRNSIRRSGKAVRVLSLEHSLDLDRASNGIDDARKLGQHAVAREINEPTVMLLDQRIDQLAVRRKSAMSPLFVLPHEAAVAVDVGAEYGGDLPTPDSLSKAP
jgi:hypothetical protein